jgi:hypothetical protein
VQVIFLSNKEKNSFHLCNTTRSRILNKRLQPNAQSCTSKLCVHKRLIRNLTSPHKKKKILNKTTYTSFFFNHTVFRLSSTTQATQNPEIFFFPLQNQKPKPPKLLFLRKPKRIPKLRNQEELQPRSVPISLVLLLLFRKIIPLRADITKSLLTHKTFFPRALASFCTCRAGSPDQQYTKRRSFYLPVLFSTSTLEKKSLPSFAPNPSNV